MTKPTPCSKPELKRLYKPCGCLSSQACSCGRVDLFPQDYHNPKCKQYDAAVKGK